MSGISTNLCEADPDAMELKGLIENHVYEGSLEEIDLESPQVINTLNAHSFCIARKDAEFQNALMNSDILLADGISVVYASRVLTQKRPVKIAGADIHMFLLDYANTHGKRVFYLGSSEETLWQIRKKINQDFPNIRVETFSPPFKEEFSKEENQRMISKVNDFGTDILFVGMTAPKQEKWLENNKNEINAIISASIGAVFDFYSGNIQRAPGWMINSGLEWLYRLLKEPKRMWKRYIVNNNVFIYHMLKEKLRID